MSDFVLCITESASKGEIKFTLQGAMKAQRRSRGVALMQPQCYMGVGGQCHALAQCFSTLLRPRPCKLFFYKTRAQSQQIYS